MKSTKKTDVVIVGAGTAGCYTAWKLAEMGHSVTIVERKKRGTLGKNVGIFHIDEIRFEQFGIPLPEGKELIGHYPDGLAWPPDGNDVKTVRYGFYVMDLPLFILRMQSIAQRAGVKILFETKFEKPVIDNGTVTGVRVSGGGKRYDIAAKLTIDASGVDSVVRCALPADMGIENAPIDPKDFLYVILQYWDNVEGKDVGTFPSGLNFYPYHKAFINPSYGTGAIVGIGQPASLKEAERIQKEFLDERFPKIKHTLVKKTWGRTPYRRPPFSLAAGGFLIVGDAGFMTKPFSGEGVTSGFTACRIAAETADAAIRSGDTGRRALWNHNVRYFRDQGAKFAGLLAQLNIATALSRPDINYLFSEDIIFSSYDFESMNRDFEVRLGPGRLLAVAAKLVKGRLFGKLSKEGFGALLSAMGIAGKMRAHYEAYPEDPGAFEAWALKARKLWGEG